MSSGARKAKVVLFLPSYDSGELSPPLALIALAAPLLGAGFEVRIVDASMEPDFVAVTTKEMEDALCLGISLCTGPMIRDALAVSRAVKAACPDRPIIYGGWHPSICPEQTVLSPWVDLVVVGQGEMTLLEVAERLRAGEAVDDVPGTWTNTPAGPRQNPARAYVPVATLPSRLAGYDLVDYDAYARRNPVLWLMYLSSHGCPFGCRYCSNRVIYRQRYDALPAQQVVDEVTSLVRRHGIEVLGLVDDIFFATGQRGLAIAEGFLRSGLRFSWYIQDRTDVWQRVTAEQADLYRRAGLVRVHFGAESGSDRVLDSIDKRVGVDATLAAAERCREAGIRASFSFILGLPAEEEEDLGKTLDLMREVDRRGGRVDFLTNIFTPYPGAPIWDEAVSRGVRAPESLEEWVAFYPRITVLPWLSGARHRRLQRIRQYVRFAYPPVPVGEARPSRKMRLLSLLLTPAARLRLRTRRFGFPWEVHGYRWLMAVNLRLRRLLRGQLLES